MLCFPCHAEETLLLCHFGTPAPSFFALPSLFRVLSPIIPAHPRNAPVSPIIPAHTQNRGVGAVIVMVTYLKYVGAPTIPFLRERRRSQTQRFREERESPRPARDDGIRKGKRCSTRLEWRCLFFWGFGRFSWPAGGAKAGDRINVNAEEERSNRVVAQSELTLP